MSLIRNGYALSTRRGFLGVLFSALLALALFDPGGATAQQVKQIKLTEKNIQGFMAAYDDIAKLYDGANPDKRDPKDSCAQTHAAPEHLVEQPLVFAFEEVDRGPDERRGRSDTDGSHHRVLGLAAGA